MGKHVIYLRTRDEAELKAKGLDPAQWVREVVKKALAGDVRLTGVRIERRD